MNIAYLTSFYPHATDTFIRREVDALRAAGVTVRPFSVRKPGEHLAVSDDIRAERKRTTFLLEGPWKLIGATVREVLRSPVKVARAAALAYSSGAPGIKARLWQAAYLMEAAVLAGHLRRQGIEHVHNHIGENSATVAMLASVLTGISYSMTVHGPGDFDRPVTIALGEKIRRAAFVIGVTEFGRSQLYRWCEHEHWKKVHVVHCGLDATFLAAAPTEPPAEPRLVCVGRLSEQKGQLLLLDAAAKLAGEGVRFELVFIGDGPMRGEMERLVREHRLQERVKFAGWMSSEQVRDQLRAARAMVLPSFAEGLPVVIMESLAVGRPVISTYIAGIPELVENGVNGWLVPAGATGPLVDAMREALAAPVSRIAEMGLAGRERVLERHDIGTEAGKLMRLFQGQVQPAVTNVAPAAVGGGTGARLVPLGSGG